MAVTFASQQEHHIEEQHQIAATAALQPILAASFGQTDTALARQQEVIKVAECIVAMAAQSLSSTDAASQVQHAFASMFTAASLPRLASLSSQDRAAELEHLAEICIGICLFSNCNAEGLSNEAHIDLEQYMQLLDDVNQRCSILQHDLRDYMDAVVHRSSNESPQEAVMAQLSGEVAYLHQASALCFAMRDNLVAAVESLTQQQAQQEAGLREVQGLVGAALAVPREAVQPAFAALGKRHLSILKQHAALQHQPPLVAAVMGCIDADKPRITTALSAPGASSSILPMAPITDDSKGPKDPIDLAAASAASGAVRTAAADAAVSHVSLGGFCPVSFVKRAGLLVKADTKHGFVRYEDQLFGFASQELLNWFAASPQEYMDAVMLQAIQYPACIALLNLQSCFPELSLGKLIASVALEAERCDDECQTEVHPVRKHIDRKYEWNEWEHRRKALAMVNLRHKRTHGSQTILSHFRRENATQVWLPKGVASQTHVNKGQSMPRKLRHVAGLRGPPGTHMAVLNLELDLGQPYQH
ncbi:hypothetical protein WJX77_005513 [Trebouxia sp. C0004]